ncbi:TRAP transporter small permease [Nitratireductor thuwali]|uniref:TRAP transporter small permease protein n=1 Tax=Nitratireductor thuwali TaxID=2267699 RepID=A0ABY5MG34_9HYPH|nr:hypothetical protein NTH_00599 [Nitratireductor thuwali]
MRSFLNGLYAASEWLAMTALAATAILVFAQVAGRVFDTLLVMAGNRPYGFLVPSLAEIAGFLLVAASFLALAGSFRAGTHIRVTLAISPLPPGLRHVVEVAVLAVATAIAGLFAWYVALLALDSVRYNELSYGIIAIPLWIPQGAMAVGAAIFTLSLVDDFAAAVTGGTPSYLASDRGDEREVV